MKYLFFVAAWLLAGAAHAQRPPKVPLPPVPVVYCELIARQSYVLIALQLDYGQEKPTNAQDADLAVDAAYVAKLASAAAALNYLYGRGWECVGSAAAPYDADKSGTVRTGVHYLLHRRAP
ncbi:hypothetical protein [Hymenobacter nivis]|uniref:Uncharacterized protein n=1 Tax=Hymenobacter nivis TaxID=1850093 RepID=A0A502GCV1_9BACT|nr:hypothetical protein [Hymenobacter nivis]TPG59492.1 hypothetical protein EAH73_21510 [Hymenobacter nivis]